MYMNLWNRDEECHTELSEFLEHILSQTVL